MRLFLQGRVVAQTYDEAVRLITDKLASKGYRPAGKVKPYPANVQYLKDTWWEWQVEIREK